MMFRHLQHLLRGVSLGLTVVSEGNFHFSYTEFLWGGRIAEIAFLFFWFGLVKEVRRVQQGRDIDRSR